MISGISTATEGTGFGLHIVEQIANAYRWEISVIEGSDGGAQFESTGVELLSDECILYILYAAFDN